MIKRIHHAQLCVSAGDIPKAREFYCGLLGLKEVHRPFGPNGIWVEVGPQIVHIGIDEADRQKSTSHVAYEVDDLAEMRGRLSKAGFEIEDPIAMPGHQRFQIRDPFGNQVEFIRRDQAK